MQRVLSHIRNGIEALKVGDTGSCMSAMECAAKLVEEKFTSTNKPSAEIAAATLLCEVYFNIATECIGEDEVRRRVAAATSHVG